MRTQAVLGSSSLAAALLIVTVIGYVTAPPPPASKDWTKYLTAYSGAGSRRAVPETASSGDNEKATESVPASLPVTTAASEVSSPPGLKPVWSLKPGKLGPPSFILPFIPPRPAVIAPFSPFLMPGPLPASSPYVSPKLAQLNTFFGLLTPSKALAKRDERATFGVLRPMTGSATLMDGLITTPIQTFVLPPTGAVDPNALIAKRIKFLNDLFDALGLPPSVSTVVTRALAPFPKPAIFPGPKPALTPPTKPFLPLGPPTMPALETSTLPPIVPPGFWTPTSVSDFGPKGFMDKTTEFLDKLFKTLNKTATTPATPSMPTVPTISKRASESTESTSLELTEAPPVNSAAPLKSLPPPFWAPGTAFPMGPETFISKKTEFLNNLLGGLGPTKRASDGASVSASEKLAELTDIYDDVMGLEGKIANLSTRGLGAMPSLPNTLLLDIPADLLVASSDTLGADSTSLDEVLNDLSSVSVVNDPNKTIYQRSLGEEVGENTTTNATVPDVVSAIQTAKDQIVNSIVSELVVLKTDMITTMAELSKAEKAASSKVKPPKTPPFASPFSPFSWKPTPAPKVSASKAIATGAKKRLKLLSDVFDMLAALEQNIVDTVANLTTSIKANETANAAAKSMGNNVTTVNDTLIHTILAFGKKNDTAANTTATKDAPFSSVKSAWVRAVTTSPSSSDSVTPTLLSDEDVTTTTEDPDASAEAGFPFMMDPTFWMPDPAAGPGPVDPSFYMTKTKTFLDNLLSSKMMGPPAGKIGGPMGFGAGGPMGFGPGGPMGFGPGGPMGFGPGGPFGAAKPAMMSPWLAQFAPKSPTTTESPTTPDLFD